MHSHPWRRLWWHSPPWETKNFILLLLGTDNVDHFCLQITKCFGILPNHNKRLEAFRHVTICVACAVLWAFDQTNIWRRVRIHTYNRRQFMWWSALVCYLSHAVSVVTQFSQVYMHGNSSLKRCHLEQRSPTGGPRENFGGPLRNLDIICNFYVYYTLLLYSLYSLYINITLIILL